jgi:protein phosphatase
VGLSHTRIYAGETFDVPVFQPLRTGSAAVLVRQAPYKQGMPELGNQDAAAVIPVDQGTVVLAVADGVGGAPNGDIAARLAIESLARSLENPRGGSLRDSILNAIEYANETILALGNGTATTLAVAEIDADRLRSYNVGDSGILVTGQRGRLKLQTIAHSPTGYAVEAGLIDELEALAHAERNVVSNVVGSRDLRIEIGSAVRLAPRDTVVVASDGLFDNMLTEEITNTVRCGDLRQAAMGLAAICAERMQTSDADAEIGHADDLSFILYRPTGMAR